MTRMTRIVTICFAAAIATTGLIALAGDLNPPPGAVAPTMKTLSEVEPRIAINATNTPGDADSLFKITQPGSYYLTGNISGVASKKGIEIAANNVSIDLKGFTLQGVTGSLDGIATEGVRNDLTIRNGVVSGWDDGIDFREGGIGAGSLVEGVHASNNVGRGINVTDNAIVRGCTAMTNLSTGIEAPSRAVLIEGCTVLQNGGGIYAAINCTIRNCSASGNSASGIDANQNCTISDCSAYDNSYIGIDAGEACTITNCSAENNGYRGIDGVLGCTITDCSAVFNGYDGISVNDSCTVRDNTCVGNGKDDSDGAGIFADSGRNRIEGNNCTYNGWGIRVSAGGNFITRNVCSGNFTLNWDIAANNKCLVVNGANAGAISGNAGGVSPGSTDPNANFTY